MKNDRKRFSALVTGKVKKLDPETTVQGTLLDEPSGRMFVTLVRGSRRTQFALLTRDFDNDASRIDLVLAEAVRKLPEMPIG
jgi:hypothetical protein